MKGPKIFLVEVRLSASETYVNATRSPWRQARSPLVHNQQLTDYSTSGDYSLSGQTSEFDSKIKISRKIKVM